MTVVPSEANFVMTVLDSRAGGEPRFSRTAGARSDGAAAEGVRPAELHAHFHRHGRGQPPVYRSHGGGVMPQTLEHGRAPVEQDFLPLNGTDYVEFYVGNARQAAHYYRTAFGFRLAAYRGPETGTRDRASYVLVQNKIRFVLTTPLQPEHAIARACPRCTATASTISRCGWTMPSPPGARRPARGARSVPRAGDAARRTRRSRASRRSRIYGDTIHTFRRAPQLSRRVSARIRRSRLARTRWRGRWG